LRRLAVVLACLVVLGAACKRRDPIKTEPTDESGVTLKSVVKTNDPQSAIQLLKGFHEIEQGAWRWTASHFIVSLKTPVGAAERGAVLTMTLAAPEPVVLKFGPITVKAKSGGTDLGTETYSTTGQHTFKADVPASLLKGDALTVEFTADKFLPPGDNDLRELALIVSSVGLDPK
jgi:hypothetical protein